MIATELEKLSEWLESWRTGAGAYNGFIIHRFYKKRMFMIHDTAWTQAAIIRGYANLYESDKSRIWHERMQLAADLQCSRLDYATGKYRYAGHEDDRFCSLVHCALANCSLLRAAAFTDNARSRKYLDAVKCNVDNYCEHLWEESEGAYKFSEIDFWSPDEDRFVINFNMMAAENLILLWEKTGIHKYMKRAIALGEWLIRCVERTRRAYDTQMSQRKSVPASSESCLMPPGGLPYQFTPSTQTPDDFVLIYTGLALRGICALYKMTKDERYSSILLEAGGFLLAMRDPRTRFFYHTAIQGKIVKMPQFIAGLGMILTGLHEARKLLQTDWNWDDTLTAVRKMQYPNGSYPSFIGKNMSMRGKLRDELVWEDAAAAVNWNAQLFEYFTMVDWNSVPAIDHQPLSAKRFFYLDTPRTVTVISLFPLEFSGLLFCVKKWPYSLLVFFPYDSAIAKFAILRISKLKKLLTRRQNKGTTE